jgi:hypothetical protein
LVDVYSIYFNFSVFIFWVNQEKRLIFFIDNTVPYKGKDIQLWFALCCGYWSYSFEVLYVLIDFIKDFHDAYIWIFICFNIILMPS